MKKLTAMLCSVLLGCISATANASPLSLLGDLHNYSPGAVQLTGNDARYISTRSYRRSYKKRSHRRYRRNLAIGAAITGLAIAAQGSRSRHHGRRVIRRGGYECYVWYRGRSRVGVSYRGEPCYVNYRGRTMRFHDYDY